MSYTKKSPLEVPLIFNTRFTELVVNQEHSLRILAAKYGKKKFKRLSLDFTSFLSAFFVISVFFAGVSDGDPKSIFFAVLICGWLISFFKPFIIGKEKLDLMYMVARKMGYEHQKNELIDFDKEMMFAIIQLNIISSINIPCETFEDMYRLFFVESIEQDLAAASTSTSKGKVKSGSNVVEFKAPNN